MKTMLKVLFLGLLIISTVFCSNESQETETQAVDQSDRDLGSFSDGANMTDARMDFVSLVLGLSLIHI